MFVFDVMLISRAAAAGVESLGILAWSKGLFRDGICVLAKSCGSSNVGDVAGASSTRAESAVAMAALDSRSHDLAVNVFRVVCVNVARPAAAVGYFNSHEKS